ncbi:MAG: beta-ketoacyl-ACP synthase III [Candidatus Neomarinimicrobiota bacterium]
MKAAITTTAKYLPKQILSNFDLEKMIDTSDEWIRSRTGIENRHLVSEGQASADMATEVAKILLERSNTDKDEVDLIIIATITPDTFIPSTAARVQHNLDAQNCWGFDLSGACTGFLYALETGAKFVESGNYKKVIVIGVDTMSSIIDYTDRNTCVLFGDGAGGVLLEPTESKNGIIDSLLRIDGSGGESLIMPGGGSLHPASADTVRKKMHYVKQDGKTVYKFAVKGMADISSDILKKNNFTGDDVKLFIPHQANKRIIDAAAKRCRIPNDRVLINIDKYGNTTDATIPICMDEAVTDGLIKEGDLLLTSSFGAGFTWGSILIRWGV